MISRKIMVILLVLGSQQLQAQFMEYKPLPILPPIPQSQQIPPTQSVEEQVLAARRRRLELDILTEQRDLLRSLNGNSSANGNSSDLIKISLLGASTSDLEFNPKSQWRKFGRNSYLEINKATSKGRLYLPDYDQDIPFRIQDLNVDQRDGYSISTLELDSNNFISILNVYKESGLWVLWGTKGEQELIIFQSEK